MNLFKRNGKIYYIKYVDGDGKDIRVSTGKKKKSEALQVLFDLKSNLKRKENSPVYFTQCKDEYLEYCNLNFSNNYYNIMSFTFKEYTRINNEPDIRNIKRKTISAFISSKMKTPFQAHQHFRNLRTFFNWAIDNEYIDQSPMWRMKAPKLPEKKPKWITGKELEEIISHEVNSSLQDIYRILFYTGMRANELLSLEWNNIDLNERIIFIRNSDSFKTKTGKERAIPLSEKVYQIIYRQPSRFTERLLFTKKQRKLNVDFVSKNFKKSLRKTNLDNSIHLHSLRHSFASNLVAKGENLYHISKLLGHSRIATTEIYAHVQMKELKSVVNML